MAYTTIPLVEAQLDRDLTQNEVKLFPYLRLLVEGWINAQIDAEFSDNAVASTTRYYDGGTSIINIDAAGSITAVALVDSEEGIDYQYEHNVDYELGPRNGTTKYWIERRNGRFPRGVANVAVTGTFGLGDIPDDIKMVATIVMAELYKERVDGGKLTSESIEGYSRQFAVGLENGEISRSNEMVSLILSKYSNNIGILF